MNRALNHRALQVLDHGTISLAHDFLCHPHGEDCPDGCDVAPDPDRMEAMDHAYDALCDRAGAVK